MVASFSLLILLVDPAIVSEPASVAAPPAAAAVISPPPLVIVAPSVSAPAETLVAAPAPAPLPPPGWHTYGAAELGFRHGAGGGAGTQTTATVELERAGIEGARWLAPQLRLSGVAEAGFAAKENRDSADNESITGAFYVRQLVGTLETSIVDLRAGITWFLFGADDTYRPASLQPRGLPGQVAARGEQFQIRRLFRGASVELEFAAGLARSRSEVVSPDWQGRVRLAWMGRRGVHTAGPALTRDEPLSVSLSGLYRQLTVTEYDGATATEQSLRGGGLSLDLLVPVLAARVGQHAHALTFTGSAMIGRGIADLFSTATQDVLKTGSSTSIAYQGPGAIGAGSGFSRDRSSPIELVETRGLVLGLQYRPARGPVWASVNYGRAYSDEIAQPGARPIGGALPTVMPSSGAAAPVRDFRSADVNLFVDPLPYLRCGAGYQRLGQTFSEGTTRALHRVLLSVIAFI